MGTMRGHGMGMGAERTPHARGSRSGQSDLPKSKPDLEKAFGRRCGRWSSRANG